MCIWNHVCMETCVRMKAGVRLYVMASHVWSKTAREASWRQAFDPCTPLLFDLYHYIEQNGYFGLIPGKSILSVQGSKLVDGFDTRLSPRSFPCGTFRCSHVCIDCPMHTWLDFFLFFKNKNNMCIYIYIQKKMTCVHLCVMSKSCVHRLSQNKKDMCMYICNKKKKLCTFVWITESRHVWIW